MNHLFRFQRMHQLVLTPAMLLVALLLLTALTACGGDGADTSEDAGPTERASQERETREEGSEPEPTEVREAEPVPTEAGEAEPEPEPEPEREALIALYNATDGENWDNNTNITTTVDLKGLLEPLPRYGSTGATASPPIVLHYNFC